VSKPRTFVKVGLLGSIVYAGALRPWFLRWGATGAEVAAELPGDDIVRVPRCASTRAIAIEATPEDVWPWLAQMGQGRGGLYSYEWIENLVGCDIHNADEVIPALQDIGVGDLIRLVPKEAPTELAFEVARADVNRALVLKGRGTREEAFAEGFGYPSWTFAIERVDPRRVRLIARWRCDFEPTLSGYLWWKYGIEPIHFVMERRMLKGIKKRAERLARSRIERAA
jgi:hypothetical protein